MKVQNSHEDVPWDVLFWENRHNILDINGLGSLQEVSHPDEIKLDIGPAFLFNHFPSRASINFCDSKIELAFADTSYDESVW